MKACGYVIFTGMSKLSLDSQYMMWTVYRSLKTNSTASDGKMKLGAHPKCWTGKIKRRVLTSISIHASSPSPLHSEVDSSDYITLIQQQGYQHAGLVNLCPVRYNLWRFDTAVRTYNCSPCSKCFIPFCEMEMATAVEWNSLFPRSYMQYSTELQKLMVTFNQSNEVLFVCLCYSKLQSHLVPQSQRTST